MGGAGLAGLRGGELEVDCGGGVFLEVVGGCQGADGFGDAEEEVVGLFVVRGGEGGVVGWVGGAEDGAGLVGGAAGEALPEFFGEEGHEGVDHCEGGFEGRVERVLRRGLFGGRAAVLEDGF